MMTEPQESPLRRSRLRQKRRGGSATWSGALLGAGLSSVALMAVTGMEAGTPLGGLGDLLLAVLIGLLIAALAGLPVWGAILIARRVPPWQAAAVSGLVAAPALLLLIDSGPLGLSGLLYLLPGTLLGAALGLEWQHGIRSVPVALALTGALLLNGSILWLLLTPGSDRHMVSLPAGDTDGVRPLALPDPALPGGYPVRTLTYGSGTDRHRPAYGAEAALTTATVNGTPFLTAWQGWRGRLRTWYWGFDASALPLNGRVWYPGESGPSPLLLIVHGNHNMTQFSDQGYAYLGELLASRGYIVVSVDQNFINGGFAGDLGGQATAGRAWLLLEHLKQWQRWNEDADSPFYQRVDLDQIALIGHSRGGEAAYLAALFNRMSHFPDNASARFDYGFQIRTVVSIAPTDGQYLPGGRPAQGTDFSHLVLHGAHDGDVTPFLGIRAYERLRFTGSQYHVKASVYIHGANHGQFNTVWGRRDLPLPLGALINLRPQMEAAEQQRAAQLFVSAFLEATLRQQEGYLALFRDPRTAAHWLPQNRYLSRFADSSQLVIASFEEDADLTTATLPGAEIRGDSLSFWSEQQLWLRSGSPSHNHAALLHWQGVSRYGVLLPDELPAPWREPALAASLTIDLADARPASEATAPIALSVEIVQKDGLITRLPLNQFGQIPARLPVKLFKLGPLERYLLGEPGPRLQTVEVPLAAFSPALTPDQIQEVWLRFDGTPTGALLLDEIGLRRTASR